MSRVKYKLPFQSTVQYLRRDIKTKTSDRNEFRKLSNKKGMPLFLVEKYRRYAKHLTQVIKEYQQAIKKLQP